MSPTRAFTFGLATVSAICLAPLAQAGVPQMSGQNGPVVIICPVSVPNAVCDGMHDQLAAEFTTLAIDTQDAGPTDPLVATVQFVPLQHTEHVLAGHIEWRTAATVLIGPRVDLTVIDAPLGDHMLREFGHQLITVSPTPF